MESIGYHSGQDLTRQDVDDLPRRKKYKEEKFQGKQSTVDGYTGGKVFYSPYGKGKGRGSPRAHPTSTASNIDHIIPIDELIDRYGDWVPADVLKRIANSDYNLVVTNEELNKSKGGKSNIEFLLDELKKKEPEEAATALRMIATHLTGETHVTKDVTIYLVGYSGQLFVCGALDSLAASAVPLTVLATQDLVKVACGDMTTEEAAKEIAAVSATIAVAGGTKKIATEALGGALRNLAKEDSKVAQQLLEFSGSNQFGPALVVVSSIARSTGRYLSGEISAETLFRQVAQDSTAQIASMLASSEVVAFLGLSGGPAMAAAVLTSMLVSAVCSTIFEGAAELERERKVNREIQQVANEARRAIRLQQEELKQLIEDDRQAWLETMNNIFQTIAAGIMNNDLQKTNQGLTELMSTYNRTVHLYRSGDEALLDLLQMRRGENKKLI